MLVHRDLIACLGVEECNLARLVPSDDDVWSMRKSANDSLRANGIKH